MENGTAPEEGNWSPKSRSLTETDRYGFQRNEKWLPISQQLKWEAEYESVLAHRRARWEDLLAKHNNLLPGKSPIVQRFVRKGIPRHLRAVVGNLIEVKSTVFFSETNVSNAGMVPLQRGRRLSCATPQPLRRAP